MFLLVIVEPLELAHFIAIDKRKITLFRKYLSIYILYYYIIIIIIILLNIFIILLKNNYIIILATMSTSTLYKITELYTLPLTY